MDQCQCTDPFGWTDHPEKTPTPFPSEDRFRASLRTIHRTVYCTRVSHHSSARVQLIKMGQCQCTDPFGWTDQPDNRPYALPSECRFEASPGATTHTQFQVEEKDCEARRPHSPLLRKKGCAIFSIALELSAPGPEC